MISDTFDLDNIWNLDKLYLIISPTLKLIKEIKGDPQRWKDIPRSGTGRITTLKIATLPKTVYRFNVLLLFRTLSHIQLLHPHGPQPARLLCPWNFPGKNPGAACHFFLQGTFPTQGSKLHLLCLLHCRQTLPAEPSGFSKFFYSLFEQKCFKTAGLGSLEKQTRPILTVEPSPSNCFYLSILKTTQYKLIIEKWVD